MFEQSQIPPPIHIFGYCLHLPGPVGMRCGLSPEHLMNRVALQGCLSSAANRFRQKLRAHFHFIAKQRAHQDKYGIKRIRAVLIETLDGKWAMELREAARHPTVCGNTPTPLFWFTTSELFTKEHEIKEGTRVRKLPNFLLQPEIVLDRVWASPVDDTLYSLVE